MKERVAERIYVPPAPADDGQCVGNALVVSMSAAKRRRAALTASVSAALGPEPRVDSAAVSEALHRSGNAGFIVFENPQTAR